MIGAITPTDSQVIWPPSLRPTATLASGGKGTLKLLHLRVRWYMPEMGTFLSRDPVESEPTKTIEDGLEELYFYYLILNGAGWLGALQGNFRKATLCP